MLPAPRWPFAVGGLVLGLLLLLGWLQLRSLQQVAAADAERRRAAVSTAAARFAADFDHQLARVILDLHPVLHRSHLGDQFPADEHGAGGTSAEGRSLAQSVAERLARWRSGADYPDLIAGIYWLPAPVERAKGSEARMQRLDVSEDGAARWRPVEPDTAFGDLISASEVGGLPAVWRADVPALVLPWPGRSREAAVAGAFERRRRARDRPRGRERGPTPRPDGASLIVHLDQAVLRDALLTDLSRRYFPDPNEYALRVVDLGAASGMPTTVFTSGPEKPDAVFLDAVASDAVASDAVASDAVASDAVVPDATAWLFGPPSQRLPAAGGLPRPSQRDGEIAERRRAAGDRSPARSRAQSRGHRLLASLAALNRSDDRAAGGIRPVHGWQLSVVHTAGSIEAAVGRAERRSLLLYLAVLALLAGAGAMLVLAVSRSRRLAARQLEFVAGVTHELMTPIAAVRSAGQNLADGVVEEPAAVARYGEMIEREGRRLAEAIGQVLAFAGMQTRRPRFARRVASPADIARQALSDVAPLVAGDAAGEIEAELDISGDLPDIEVDRAAVTRAIAGLLTNAAKYGQGEGERWIGLRVFVRGESVVFAVSDRGPGVSGRERELIFEPFYRGRQHTASAVTGSGLGLSLIRHIARGHGGDIELMSTDRNRGATFELSLPAARSAEEPAS